LAACTDRLVCAMYCKKSQTVQGKKVVRWSAQPFLSSFMHQPSWIGGREGERMAAMLTLLVLTLF